jgi:hypothetical protein
MEISVEEVRGGLKVSIGAAVSYLKGESPAELHGALLAHVLMHVKQNRSTLDDRLVVRVVSVERGDCLEVV